jgi:hypothetical protein
MSCIVKVDASLIDSGVYADVVALLKSRSEAWFITQGWRDQLTEQAGYNKFISDPVHNPKYTHPSNSAHVGANFPDGKSRAVDITLVIAGKDDWDYTHPAWQALIAQINAHPRLHSGVWFADPDHIEKVHWQRDKGI